MKKNFLKSLALSVITVGASLSFAACGNNGGSTPSKPKKEYDYTYFNGICALTGEFNNGVDVGLTNDWTKKAVGSLGAKSVRLWIANSGLFIVGENDSLKINKAYYDTMVDHVTKLQEAGAENFLLMTTSFVYPSGYSSSTGYVVPDPVEEYEFYIRWLHMQRECAKRTYELFPMIKNYEPANEPDFPIPGCIHKNGYRFDGGDEINSKYVYNDTEKTSILADLCWYVRDGLFQVDDKAKVAFPGLTNRAQVPEFMELVYERIESKCLPAGQEFADVDPDNYFDIINWHPYPNEGHVDDSGNVKWDAWLNYQYSVYDVCTRHGDGDKEVYFSELGWSDFGNGRQSDLDRIADNLAYVLPLIREKLKFVTAVFVFRLTNLYYQPNTDAEKNFGLFYHPNDPKHHGAPKPAAYAVAKFYNGENYNLDNALKA